MNSPETSGGGVSAFSANEIKRLGKRLRDGSRAEEDLRMLHAFRTTYDPLLIAMSGRVDQLLAQNGFRFVLSGRAKRTKSIIRKLQRPRNHGMDLSRMGDLVGFRVLLGSTLEQDRAIQVLQRSLALKGPPDDYRSGGEFYRSVHLTVRDDSKLVEIQLRTLPQHLWAVESESFGEQVKEGNLVGDVGIYLEALSRGCVRLDGGEQLAEGNSSEVPFMAGRLPFSGLHARLVRRFERVSAAYEPSQAGNTFIVVFDNELGQLLHEYVFEPQEREAAVAKYRWLATTFPDSRFESLIFNSASADVLALTHPRFFPEGHV